MNKKEDKVLTLLTTFSKYERSRLRRFLLSPYFNENENLIHFYNSIEDFLGKPNRKISREGLWKKAFGKKKFQEQAYRRLCSDLTKLAYRFLSIEWHERQSFSHWEGTLKKVNSADLNKHYLTALRNVRKGLEESTIRNSDYFYTRYVSEYESHVHLERIKAKRNSLTNLQEADTNLDVFYIANKLKHYCDALNYKTILSIEIDVKILPRLIEFIETYGYLKFPVVHIYYCIVKTINEPENTENYFLLESLLKKHYLSFPPSELKTLYIYATNFCIKSLNSGNRDFFEHLYDLYFTMLDKKTIFNATGVLDERHYKNIITLGIGLKDYKGVEQFILEYSLMLKKENQENARTYNLAHLYFATQDYDKVIEQLNKVEYKDVFYALGSKTMLLKTYYELDEYLAMDSQIDSFRIYLRRNKLISGKKRTQYLNFLRFFKKMTSIPSYDKQAYTKLENKIKDNVEVYNKNWLIEKISNLK